MKVNNKVEYTDMAVCTIMMEIIADEIAYRLMPKAMLHLLIDCLK